MSPAFTAAFPATVTLLGGQQSARTIHFFGTIILFLFVLIHIAMICRAGFWTRVRAMITGHAVARKEHA
jgi:thiosulfate reductase cytochrome b subunit